MLDLDNDTILLDHDSSLSEEEFEELFASKALIGNPSILKNPFVFEKLCFAFNKIKADFDNITPASILMIAKAVKKINSILKKPDYDNEIKWYIAYKAHDEGWLKLPEILSFAQNNLNELIPGDVELNSDIDKLQELKHKAVEKYISEQ